MEVWTKALSLKALPITISVGIIKLIHKKGEKETIKNKSPITMLNCSYKIYAKVLAQRITNHMKTWIKKEQKSIIKGRYILHVIIATYGKLWS